ncbi:LysM peptidoglycan-binding domain-containing protein [Polaromonas sp. YR568]|uniref:LysM peptidoglycan-binding domain-containing protein n=1 Tax=Polaromonas sp. YR568 TaxID=1855301 RepID=UPI0031381D14
MHTISGRLSHISIAASLLGLALAAAVPGLHAQNFPITADQKATATQVAETGVPLSDLAPNAPDNYTVRRGDTLWAISGMFLKSPWRWPELWGMNLQDVRNPHRIYPGQQLYLEKSNGRATLRTRRASTEGPPTDTVRVSPRTRYEGLADVAIPTLPPNVIEPFLTETLIVDETTLASAPRIVAAQEGRVLLSRGDRAYARGLNGSGAGTGVALSDAKGQPRDFRVFRNATPLKDPTTQKILGYEARYLGKAELVRGESVAQVEGKDGKIQPEIIPATIDIVSGKEEMRAGDRLVAEPPRELLTYTPRAPSTPVTGQVVSVHGNAVAMASENQVVVINRGALDGMERGHVLAIIKDGARLIDKTDSGRTAIKLPNERNGLLMVFRTYDHLSYALVLSITDGVKVGDRVINPN